MTISIKWAYEAAPGKTNLFYFTSANIAKKNLKAKTIKISRFDRCNDIFELASFSMSSPDSRKKHRAWLKLVQDSLGLICFSETWRNPLMWAHYADRGQGVCLVYSAPKVDCHPVTYIQSRLARGDNFVFPEPKNETEFKKFCATKFSAWSYEREVRVFCELNDRRHVIEKDGLHFRKTDESVFLKGIINGPRPSAGQTELRDAAGIDTNFFQCRSAFKDFRVVSQQDTDLWKK